MPQRKITEDGFKEKKHFDKRFRYCLQICCIKSRGCHSGRYTYTYFYDDSDDVCLLVRDEVRGRKQDAEVTSQQNEQIFRHNKIDFIKVMPLNELK